MMLSRGDNICNVMLPAKVLPSGRENDGGSTERDQAGSFREGRGREGTLKRFQAQKSLGEVIKANKMLVEVRPCSVPGLGSDLSRNLLERQVTAGQSRIPVPGSLGTFCR